MKGAAGPVNHAMMPVAGSDAAAVIPIAIIAVLSLASLFWRSPSAF